MKLIHCADLHLHSRLSAHLSHEQAKKRNEELTASFVNMVRYACDHDISAILISGDMFDTDSVPAGLRNTVYHAIETNPDITFFYLRGNHDDNNLFIRSLDHEIDNLKCFESGTWNTYAFDLGNTKLTVSGIEDDGHGNIPYAALHLSKEDLNIVMMHGQISEYDSSEPYTVCLNRLQNRNIDYAALGHIHAYARGKIDARGEWCYCGCMEGRGFDEAGEHGFVVLETDEARNRITSTFVPFATRHVHVFDVDVSTCNSTVQMADVIRRTITSRASSEDIVRVVLKGEVSADCEKNITALKEMLKDMFFYLDIRDETKLFVDMMDYAKDASLKGEFVRTVMSDPDMSEEEKSEVIRCGILALSGEEFE